MTFGVLSLAFDTPLVALLYYGFCDYFVNTHLFLGILIVKLFDYLADRLGTPHSATPVSGLGSVAGSGSSAAVTGTEIFTAFGIVSLDLHVLVAKVYLLDVASFGVLDVNFELLDITLHGLAQLN